MACGQAPWRLLLPCPQCCQLEALTEGGRVPVPCRNMANPPQFPFQNIWLVGGLVLGIGGHGVKY